MNAQLNDTHYTVIAAIHEQMPSHLFMGDDNTLMWYTDRPGGKEEHSLRFAVYGEKRAFISALESEGYFAQTSVTGLMFRRDSTRIPASVLATIYKPKQDDQDDREIRQNAQIHANLAIAYELAAIVMEAHSSVSNALYYRQCASNEVSQIPLYLHAEYRQQLSHALYINGYLR